MSAESKWPHLRDSVAGWLAKMTPREVYCLSFGFLVGGVTVHMAHRYLSHSDTEAAMRYYFGWSVALSLFGAALYWRIYRRIDRAQSTLTKLSLAFSHVPETSAWEHILAGTFFFLGVCMAIGGFYVIQFPDNKVDLHSFVATSAGLVMGVTALAFAFWTLYQTKRLEHLKGEDIASFESLVAKITHDLVRLKTNYNDSSDLPVGGFRVFIVTNNPYFGILSLRKIGATGSFRNALTNAAELFKERRGKDIGYRFKIICADAEHLSSFNAIYLGDDARQDPSKANTINGESNDLIAQVQASIGPENIIRLKTLIPTIQFVVVGNVVFEFILETPKETGSIVRATSLRHANRMEDQNTANRYEQYVAFLIDLARSDKVEHPNGTAVTVPMGAAASGGDDAKASTAMSINVESEPVPIPAVDKKPSM